jgi:hypothetical protein
MELNSFSDLIFPDPLRQTLYLHAKWHRHMGKCAGTGHLQHYEMKGEERQSVLISKKLKK